MGMRGCPLCRLLLRCLPCQPELVIGAAMPEIEMSTLLSRRASSSAVVTRATFAASAASTSALTVASSAATSRATLAAIVAAVARSRSYAMAISTSCWHHALEVTKGSDMVWQ
jgi:hypothetical protein